MESTRPQPTEYAPFYETYIALVPGTDVWPALRGQAAEVERLFGGIGADDETFRYAPNKWTFRDVAGHLIDGERIFGARAFCFSRGEQAPLPSFDENVYVVAGKYGGVPLRELVAEFASVRAANIAFLSRLEEERWMRVGTASSRPISVRAIAYILAGHVQHHLGIVEERYLPAMRA
ncbi:MAG: DinB family protein [Ignavibacteriae bacterium]|nr:DinB family protein [Ignavibacteriota bacterium]